MKVVLIGDSIRMEYQPLVAKKFEGEVWGPADNGRHSLWALDHFQEYVADQKPDLVHFNFGIWDASVYEDGEHYILPAQYRLCLQRFICSLKRLGDVRMIWAATTPLYAPEESVPMSRWQIRANAEVAKYNAAALEIARREAIAVNDLHDVIIRNDFTKCICEDGCHMTEFGNEVLSDAVVQAIRAAE